MKTYLCAIVVLFTSIASARTWHINSKDSHLELEVDTTFSSSLNEGESPVINGHFCLRKERPKHCLLLTPEDLSKYEVKFFYPDHTEEVTSKVSINLKEDRHDFSFVLPTLLGNENPIFIAQIINKGSKVHHYQKLHAKFEALSSKLLQKKAHWPKNGKENVKKLLDALRKVESRLKLKLQGETALIAKREFPLQVGNNISKASEWSNAAEEWQVDSSVSLGNNFEGEKSWINTTLTPYVTNTYDWKIEYKLDGTILKSFVVNNPTGMIKERFLSPAFIPGIHDLEIKIYKNKKENDKSNIKWDLTFQKIYSFSTFSDNETPTFSNITPAPGRYVSKNQHSLSYKAIDLNGRIDQNSIKAVFRLQTGEQLDLSSDLSYVTDGEVLVPELHGNQEGSSGYNVSGTFTNLPEGIHELSLRPFDFADNQAQGAEWTLIYDRTPPLVLLPFTKTYSTNDPSFELPVTVSDLTKTHLKIYVNSILQLDIEATHGDFSDVIGVELVEGANLVTIEAIDEALNTTTVRYPPIILDSIPPEISSINLAQGDLIQTKHFTLSGSSNENLQAVLINGEEIDIPENSESFAHILDHLIDGPQRVEITLVDLAGNSNTYGFDYEFYLRLLDPNLIAVLASTEEGKLKIVGYPGATYANFEVSGVDGLFNTDQTTAKEDGSFELTLDTFTYAKVTAFDSSRNRGESAVVAFTADTTLAGTVKDINDNPLPEVTVTILSSGQWTKTDTNGNFAITSPALGDQVITIDGRTIPEEITKNEKAFSVTTMNVSLGNKQKNIIDRPIYLAPKILDGSETTIEPGQAITVSSPHAPGVEIDIPANVTIFPGGAVSGSINVMEIPAQKTSVQLLEMSTPDTVYALEPSGLKFSQRVDLTLPNVNDFPEGTELVILSKNSETGNWEVDGSANIVDNMVKTKPGEGISHFSEVYASPLGMEIKAFKDDDRPSIDSMNGAVTTSVSLPSFKSMGQDISPSLVYNSNWANPNIVISNIFDLPRKYIEMSKSVSKGGSLGSAKAKVSVKKWIIPQYIDAQFITGDYTSDKVRFTGMPDHSLVSYQADLGEIPSGIHPAKSSYEIRFKELTLTTQKVKTKSFGRTKTKTKRWRDEKLLEEIFPQELVTTIWHQNKKDSEYGSGWRLNLAKRILNPDQDRVMLEHENGQVAAYSLKNTVETVQYDEKGIRSFAIDGSDVIGVNQEGSLLRTSNGSTVVERVLPPYQGEMGVNTSWYTRYTRKCVKSGFSGCKKRRYTYYYACNKYKLDFNHQRRVKSMVIEGGNLVYLDQTGAVFGNDNQFPISGDMYVPTKYTVANNATSEQNVQSYCVSQTGGNCETTRKENNSYIIAVESGSRNTIGWCNNPGFCYSGNCENKWRESSGFIPQTGHVDGLSTRARYNAPRALIKGPRPQTYLVADYGNNLIRMVDLTSGDTTTVAGNKKTLDDGNGGPALSASIYHPRGLAVLDDSSYLISSEGGYIRRVTTDGRINAYIGKPTSKGGILADITDMREVALSSPSGMVYDSENNYLYVADTGHNRILRMDLTTEEARVVAGNGTCSTESTFDGKAALDISLCRPEQIALDASKNLLVLDEPNKRVRRINFRTPEDGLIRYQPLAKDNTELLRNQNGDFILKARDGTETLFSASGLELQTVDRVGRSTSYQYDSANLLRSATLPTGQTIQLNYNGNKLSTITDTAGRSTQFNYSNSHLVSVSYPDGTDKSFDYNDRGVLVAERNQRNIETHYELNLWGRLNRVRRPDGSSITMEDMVSKTIANNNVNGNSSELKSLTSDQNELRDLISDAKGNTTAFSRDTNGYVQEIEDAQGYTTKIERDIDGQPTKIIKPDNTFTEMSYDPATGDLLRRYESDSDLSETYSYNTYGQLTSYKDPLNNMKVNTYDSVTGLLLKETDPNGNFVQNSYNSLGLILTSSNSLNQTTKYSYNSQGNVVEITAPMGEKSTFVRNEAGNVTSKTNAKFQTTSYSFDAFNRLTSVTTPGNFTTSYTYLPSGELTLITNPEGFETHFEYDDLGRLRKKTSPKGQVTQLFYDKNDNVVKEITPMGDQKLFIYNEKNQLVQKTLPDDTYSFIYSNQGDLIATSNRNSSFEMTYVKILGENYLKTVTSNVLDLPKQTTTYGYSAAGKRTHMSNNYLSLTYSYDNAYRMTGVTNNFGESFQFGYDNANRLSQINRSNNVNSTLSFDNNSFLTNFSHKKGSEIIENFIYTRDQIGNRTAIQTSRGSFTYGYDSENQLITASHPEADELHALETFTYDSLGNRTSDNQGNYSYDDKKFRLDEDYKYLYVYDLNGNLISKQEKGMNGEVWNYVYNSENQMIEASYYEGTTKIKTVSFFYDAFGRRVKKAVENFQNNSISERRYAYDSNEIIAELDESNNILATYTHSGLRTDDVLSAKISSSGASRGLAPVPGSYTFLKDGLGSVQAITNESGQLVQRYIYSSFGKLLKTVDATGIESTNIKTAFAFTNREIDQETGLYYYRARYYDPKRGQYLTEDPDRGYISIPMTFINSYAYASNSPSIYSDPSGRSIFNKMFTTINQKVAATTAPILAAVSSFNSSQTNGGELWQSILVGLSSAFFTALAGSVAAAANFYLMNPVLADILTPIATGVIAGAQNATNQFIMSKGQKVDWNRAANAGAKAAAIHAIANSSTYLLGPAYSANPFIDYASAASSVACVDDGVAPRTRDQVEADSITNFDCDWTYGF